MRKIFATLLFLNLVFHCTPLLNFYVLADDAAIQEGENTSASPPTITIADFNREDLMNNLNGESGTWEQDPYDKSQWIRVSLDGVIRRGSSGSSLRLEYNVNSPNDAVNGFWTQLKFLDVSKYDHFEFWVKGDEKNGFTTKFKIEFKKFQKNEEGGEDTIKASYIVKGVTSDWQKISIPLGVMNGILDWKDTRELVIGLEKKRVDKPEGVLYFDDFSFVNTGNPGPKITDIVEHKKKKTKEELSPEEFAKFLISRLKGFPKKVFVNKEFPEDDKKLLLEIAEDTWKYFDNIVDKVYELPLDNIQFSEKATVSGDTRVGDYTSVTNIGLYLMCLVSGYDFGFLSKEAAAKRINLTLDSIEKLEKYNNFPYNYYDVTIFERTSNFISFVDSGWLAAGIIVAKNAFPEEVELKCQKILDEMDFSFFYDPVEDHMYHGFYTNINYYSEHHYGAFYTEPRAISYIAIGKA
ncbi:MAG: hypothetical protein HZA72_02160, partial [Candidatus Omnitrophica bacterium]|nr:hypothetical protein [Candidatus Omnitrophota bacterium]